MKSTGLLAPRNAERACRRVLGRPKEAGHTIRAVAAESPTPYLLASNSAHHPSPKACAVFLKVEVLCSHGVRNYSNRHHRRAFKNFLVGRGRHAPIRSLWECPAQWALSFICNERPAWGLSPGGGGTLLHSGKNTGLWDGARANPGVLITN